MAFGGCTDILKGLLSVESHAVYAGTVLYRMNIRSYCQIVNFTISVDSTRFHGENELVSGVMKSVQIHGEAILET